MGGGGSGGEKGDDLWVIEIFRVALARLAPAAMAVDVQWKTGKKASSEPVLDFVEGCTNEARTYPAWQEAFSLCDPRVLEVRHSFLELKKVTTLNDISQDCVRYVAAVAQAP
ncbi:hypothetical protein QQP08_026636 [Theobroma cacao]|nr:hypothetical protein QQP08_026636 [Theobroma cacao]